MPARKPSASPALETQAVRRDPSAARPTTATSESRPFRSSISTPATVRTRRNPPGGVPTIEVRARPIWRASSGVVARWAGGAASGAGGLAQPPRDDITTTAANSQHPRKLLSALTARLESAGAQGPFRRYSSRQSAGISTGPKE
jgi:hypothetical protein